MRSDRVGARRHREIERRATVFLPERQSTSLMCSCANLAPARSSKSTPAERTSDPRVPSATIQFLHEVRAIPFDAAWFLSGIKGATKRDEMLLLPKCRFRRHLPRKPNPTERKHRIRDSSAIPHSPNDPEASHPGMSCRWPLRACPIPELPSEIARRSSCVKWLETQSKPPSRGDASKRGFVTDPKPPVRPRRSSQTPRRFHLPSVFE